MRPSWYGTLCVGTGATVPYGMHLRILAGMVHCVLVQVLLCEIGCTNRMNWCILAGMVHCVLVQVLLRDIGCICAS